MCRCTCKSWHNPIERYPRLTWLQSDSLLQQMNTGRGGWPLSCFCTSVSQVREPISFQSSSELRAHSGSVLLRAPFFFFFWAIVLSLIGWFPDSCKTISQNEERLEAEISGEGSRFFPRRVGGMFGYKTRGAHKHHYSFCLHGLQCCCINNIT